MGVVDNQRIIMAIREVLMEYFKGSCVDSVVSHDDIQVIPERSCEQRSYFFLRREEENRDPTVLIMGEHRLLTMERQPAKLTLHVKNLDRNAQLRAVRAGVEDFMGKYLMGIPVALSTTATQRVRRSPMQVMYDEYVYHMQEAYGTTSVQWYGVDTVQTRPTTYSSDGYTQF